MRYIYVSCSIQLMNIPAGFSSARRVLQLLSSTRFMVSLDGDIILTFALATVPKSSSHNTAGHGPTGGSLLLEGFLAFTIVWAVRYVALRTSFCRVSDSPAASSGHRTYGCSALWSRSMSVWADLDDSSLNIASILLEPSIHLKIFHMTLGWWWCDFPTDHLGGKIHI